MNPHTAIGYPVSIIVDPIVRRLFRDTGPYRTIWASSGGHGQVARFTRLSRLINQFFRDAGPGGRPGQRPVGAGGGSALPGRYLRGCPPATGCTARCAGRSCVAAADSGLPGHPKTPSEKEVLRDCEAARACTSARARARARERERENRDGESEREVHQETQGP
jgi:hypothetical protein